MTLALASVAPADDHIDESFIPAPVESKVTGCPDRHICRRAPLRVDDYVGDQLELIDVPLGFVFTQGCIGGQFLQSAPRRPISSLKLGERRLQMKMHDSAAE